MITAIVRINCEMGKVPEVAEQLVNLSGVAEVYSVAGDFDILAIVRVREYEAIGNLVAEKIAGMPHVTKTLTHMAFRCYSRHDMERMWAEFIDD